MDKTRPRNIVFLMADQLRADCLGCYGNPIIQTPNIDRLAASGVRFTRAFAQHPQCAPSRASIFTGRYPHTIGAISNHVAMAECEHTLGEILIEAGYQSIAVGKTHLFSRKVESSFTGTLLSEGQLSDATDPEKLSPDYTKWIKEHGYWDALKEVYAGRAGEAYRKSFQAVPSTLPLEAYMDCWVGDRAVETIGKLDGDSPFFLFVSFPGPHHPFDPPEPYASMYEPEDMPLPESFHSDLSVKPPQHLAYKTHGRKNLGANYENLDAGSLQRVKACYYGNITLVDDQVGKVLEALDKRGLRKDSLIVFTADHGELLGHHGLLLKSTDRFPMLYDVSLHVPLIFNTKCISSDGGAEDSLVELIDIFPTLLDFAGIEVSPYIQGESLMNLLRQKNRAGRREYVFAESGAVKMLRGERYKLVYYPGREYGELYDLKEDPQEIDNLYVRPEYGDLKREMIQSLLDRLILTEGARHGESGMGAAYWRQSYKLPFLNSSIIPERTDR